MSKRTDIHRPSAIIPADYEFVANDYLGGGLDGLAMVPERRILRAHRERTGGHFSDHEHGGSCGICGAHALYVAHFYHAKTNTYLTTGHDCALKMDIGDAINFRIFRKAIAARRRAAAERSKAFALLKQHGLEAAWDIYAAEDRSAFEYEENTIYDIVSKAVQYGDPSERALNYLHVLLKKIRERASIKAQREAELAAAAPVPVTDERVEIEGEVLSTKVVDGFHGPTTKMLVKTTAGFRLWGTVPAVLLPIERGAHVKFKARIEPSRDDPKFGFFSRPTTNGA